jgi:hypothetical protein
MSSFGPLLPSLLAAPPEDEVEVEPCSVPLDEELLFPELLEPAGTVVITGSVISGNPLPGEFPHALAASARGNTSERVCSTSLSLHDLWRGYEPGSTKLGGRQAEDAHLPPNTVARIAASQRLNGHRSSSATAADGRRRMANGGRQTADGTRAMARET